MSATEYAVERLLRSQIGDELFLTVSNEGVYRTGVVPAPYECMALVQAYGDEMWDILSELDGYTHVPNLVMSTALSPVQSHAEWCVSMVAMVIEEIAHRVARELEGDDV